MQAIDPIVATVREDGYQADGPYDLADEDPIFGFTVWKPPTRVEDNDAVDVWWRFIGVHDEKPVRYYPALDLITRGGREIGATSFWGELVDLDDDKTIRTILENLDSDTSFILDRLDRHEWPDIGPKGWSPRKGR